MRSLCVLRLFSLGLCAFVLALLSILPAQAQSYTLQGDATPVSATLHIVSLRSNEVVFTFENTSRVASKITGIGFDLNGETVTVTSPGPTPAPFVFTAHPGSVPQAESATLDFALSLDGGFTGSGSPEAGLSVGETSPTFTVHSATDSFAGMTARDLAKAAYVRFHAVNSTLQTSDVAHALTTPLLPESGSYAFGGAFFVSLIGLLVRACPPRLSRNLVA